MPWSRTTVANARRTSVPVPLAARVASTEPHPSDVRCPGFFVLVTRGGPYRAGLGLAKLKLRCRVKTLFAPREDTSVEALGSSSTLLRARSRGRWTRCRRGWCRASDDAEAICCDWL